MYPNMCPMAPPCWYCAAPNMYRSEDESIECKFNKNKENKENTKIVEEQSNLREDDGTWWSQSDPKGKPTMSLAEIEKLLEMHHPDIIKMMTVYGIPLSYAKQIIIRILKFAAMHKM